MLGAVLCLLSGHKVNRNRVWHDGTDFRTCCARCNDDLLRDVNDGWRSFDLGRDGVVPRNPHPKASM